MFIFKIEFNVLLNIKHFNSRNDSFNATHEVYFEP